VCAAAVAAGCGRHYSGAMEERLARHTIAYRSGKGEVAIAVAAIGSGPRIVMLPSVGRDVDDFFPVADRLAEAGYRVLLPSPRGIGGSLGPLTDIDLADLAADVAEVIRQDPHEREAAQAGTQRAGQQDTQAVVAGHAFGNWIARMAAVRHPDLVTGVVLLAAAHRDFPAWLRDTIDHIMDATQPRAERLAHLQRAFFAPGHEAQAWLEGWHAEVARVQRQAGRATPTVDWWSAGSVPLLDLQAGHDLFAPRSGANLLRDELGPRVSIEVIEDAGHALLPEQPDRVAEAIARFMARLADR
jgi:pimeloyl-ACP methyl ester carboxylesterase